MIYDERIEDMSLGREGILKEKKEANYGENKQEK